MNQLGDVVAHDGVCIERLLPGPIDRVWSYLVDSQKRRTWMAAGEIELRPGGRAEFIMECDSFAEKGDLAPPKYADANGSRNLSEVIECEPPRLLTYHWIHAVDLRSEVRFELTTRNDKVLLTLTHRRLPTRDALLSVSAGWHNHLDILAARLSGEEPRSFWKNMMELERLYEPRIPQW